MERAPAGHHSPTARRGFRQLNNLPPPLLHSSRSLQGPHQLGRAHSRAKKPLHGRPACISPREAPPKSTYRQNWRGATPRTHTGRKQRPELPTTIPTPWTRSKAVSTKRQTVPEGLWLRTSSAATSCLDRRRGAPGPPAESEPPDTQTASRQATERVSCRHGGGGPGETRSRTYGARQEVRGQSARRRTQARRGSRRRRAAAKSAMVRRHRATHQRGRRGLKAST